jgi:hypothetical protein
MNYSNGRDGKVATTQCRENVSPQGETKYFNRVPQENLRSEELSLHPQAMPRFKLSFTRQT